MGVQKFSILKSDAFGAGFSFALFALLHNQYGMVGGSVVRLIP